MKDIIRVVEGYLDEKKTIRLLVAVLLISTAFLFFGSNGEKEVISIDSDTEQATVTEKEPEKKTSASIYIDIGGEVKKPGVYEMDSGARVYEVIDQAGGLTEEADTSSINQAEMIEDGSKIYIPSVSEKEADTGSEHRSGIDDKSGSININTADADELQSIPGIGPVTAEKIIDYRKTNGPFTNIEDLKLINGIGDKTFEKMKDKVSI